MAVYPRIWGGEAAHLGISLKIMCEKRPGVAVIIGER
jgi:hypothetical protein